jgi:hypothetical protein
MDSYKSKGSWWLKIPGFFRLDPAVLVLFGGGEKKLVRVYFGGFPLVPLLFMERVGSYSYGLVAGKARFYEPWEGLWEKPGLDLKLWQHDLFRKNHRPYDPAEIELIKTLTGYAGEQFKMARKNEDL